ncbi:MAG TPA: ATP-binding protein, partial [Nannocystaceae bacterium]|nr:ATP-binding protein [Nannocystaceae bacterium]
IEAGRLEATYEPIELDVLTRELAEVFRPVLEGAGLRFVVDCPPLGTAVHVDRQLWERILFNLLSNAFKYTLAGAVEVMLARVGDHVVLRVRDTGCGIPAAELPRLFERFHRVAGNRGRTIEGTGIGLALVHELVKLHGGAIEVDSEVDRGTELRVAIPIGTAHLPSARIGAARERPRNELPTLDGWLPAQAVSARRKEPPSDAARILVVDDNADVRAFMLHLLGDTYRVECVDDGEAALVAARRERPDLVISDVMMPKLDGFGLLAALRSDAALHDLPVILLSARAGEEARAEGIEAGADDYIVKPFGARELLARVSARLELARMAALVRAESDAMHELFAQTPVPTAVLRGRELVFERANDACIAVLGGRDLLGRPLLAVLPELAGQGLDRVLHDVLDSGRSHVLTEAPIELVRDDSGAPRPGHWNLTFGPIRDEGGHVGAVIVIGSEVTDEVRARASIAQSEARYREEAHSLEALHRVGIALAEERDLQRILQTVTDTATAISGARFGAFFYNVVDQAGGSYMLYTLSGAPREAFEGFGLPRNTAVFAPTFAGEAPVRLDDVRADPRYGHSAPHYGMPKGHLPVRSYLAVPVVSRSGEPIGGLFFGHPEVGVFDERAERLVVGIASQAAVAIDNARLDEQRVELIAQLRDGDRRKDEFLATLSHELRNPLAPLRSGLQLLRMRNGEDQLLPVLERQVDHLVRLVDDLLEVSRISQGHLELRTQPIELGSVVANVLDTIAPQIAASGVELGVEVATGLWVQGDAVRLAQILTNLLANALKYTARAGTIAIAARRDGDDIVLAVRDSGCGISASAIDRVFDMFDRGDQASGLGPGGLGVGLSISRRLAQLHGGSLTAHSAGIGHGSEFALRLPGIAGVRVEPPARAQPRELPPRRVLVVDDNVDAAEMLALLLQSQDMTVHVADGGRVALELFARHDPEVVLLDIGMPEIDGYEVARRIRAEFPERRPILVALTGWGQQDDRRRVREAGFDHHLVKPAELETLRALLSSIERQV